MSDRAGNSILDLTAQIVSAHLSNNRLETDALPSLIQSVYRTLSTAESIEAPLAAAPIPAVPVKKSVFPDYLVCLEDESVRRSASGAIVTGAAKTIVTIAIMASGGSQRLDGLSSEYPQPELPNPSRRHRHIRNIK